MRKHVTVPTGYRAAEELQAALGLSGPSFRDFLRAMGVSLLANPRDRRKRLIRESDAERLLEPVPIRRRKNAVVA